MDKLSLDGLNFETICLEVERKILTITLNRPEKKNAMNNVMMNELNYALAYAKQEDSIRVVVVAANGDIFCAGADLSRSESISNVPNVTQGIVTYPVEARFIRGFEVLSVIQKFTPLLDSFSGMDLSDIPGIPGMSGMGAMPPGIGGMGDSSGDRRPRMGANNLGDNDMQELQGLLSSLLTEELPAEGMNGTVTLLKDSVQDVLLLPSEALIIDKNKINVISSISDNEIVYTEVKTGLTDGKKTEILEGLKENDSIYIKRIGQVIQEKEESTKSIDELTKGKPPMPRGGKK